MVAERKANSRTPKYILNGVGACVGVCVCVGHSPHSMHNECDHIFMSTCCTPREKLPFARANIAQTLFHLRASRKCIDYEFNLFDIIAI